MTSIQELIEKDAMEETKMKCLFLDDERMPEEVFEYTKNPIYMKEQWDIVKNYNEFVEYIQNNGVPHIFSADHDLKDVHYKTFLTPPTEIGKQEAWVEYHKQDSREKTGYDCLVWLTDYCYDNDKVFPNLLIHTMNQVGYNNMVFFYRNAVRNKFIKLA